MDRIVATKRVEVAALAGSAVALRERAGRAPPPRGFAAALRHPAEVRVLAEVKRRSPSAGAIRAGAQAVEIAAAYEAGGAAAVSVLTDSTYFAGSLTDLEQVRQAVNMPVLRKDFVIDPLQIWEARGAGADAVLLIVRILGDEQLRDLLDTAKGLGMDVLVEAHDRAELERALALGAALVGVNNRDLDTFTTDLGVAIALAASVPAGVTLVAESGIRTAADVQRLGSAGVDAILVGESLMRQQDLRAAAAALAGHPKESGGRR